VVAALLGAGAGWLAKPVPAALPAPPARVPAFLVSWRAAGGTTLFASPDLWDVRPGNATVERGGVLALLDAPRAPPAFVVRLHGADGTEAVALPLRNATSLRILQNGTDVEQRGLLYRFDFSASQVLFHPYALRGCGAQGGVPPTLGPRVNQTGPFLLGFFEARLDPGPALEGGCPDLDVVVTPNGQVALDWAAS